MMESVRTTCPYCGVGCGVIARPKPDGSVQIVGDREHPANFGRLCSKGLALGETLGMEGRLLHPEINGQRAEWDQALDLVAQRFSAAIAEHGPDAVAFYVSGQLLTEDYYVANKLMKGFIGSANIDTNSRLCMASTVAGHRRAFGSDTVPGCYEDLELADLVVLVGSNLAWCHPVLFQRLLAAREKRGTRIVVIDPRRSATAEAADLYLPIAPDGDGPLFAGLEAHLHRTGCVDPRFAPHWTKSAPQTPAVPLSIADVAAQTGLKHAQIAAFYELFAATDKVMTVWSQGVNQSTSGTDKVNAIINCHLVTGRIGKAGMGPFSVTGQPNAMGGREVGGLANMLAAHMNIEDAEARERVQRFWQSPAIASRQGLKAVDLFKAVAEGKIKALWIIGTNPAVSMPGADDVTAALAACPFVVVSDVVRNTDTTRHAHVLLPAAAWGEKDGTVTNSERRISRQRGFIPLPGEARADWDILSDVARRMGFSGFDYTGPAAIFAEHARLSGFENDGARDFDISAHEAISQSGYDRLVPFQWPSPRDGARTTPRLFSAGGFFTKDKRAQVIAPAAPARQEPVEGRLHLNTGRLRDQWHTMTRTGRVPRLMGQFGEPFCEIHPEDARRAGFAAAALVRVTKGAAQAILRVRISDIQAPGRVFVPMHWSGPFSGQARVNALVAPRHDPISGQPALKAGQVHIEPFEAAWYGFAVSVSSPRPAGLDYWAVSPVSGGYGLECAALKAVEDWSDFARELTDAPAGVEWIGLHDRANGIVRLAAFDHNRLVAALFVSSQPVEVARAFLAKALGEEFAGNRRFQVLAGRGGAQHRDEGALVCACNNVGINRILDAVEAGHRSVEAVGEACAAGTGCGSCRSDIRKLINSVPETMPRAASSLLPKHQMQD